MPHQGLRFLARSAARTLYCPTATVNAAAHVDMALWSKGVPCFRATPAGSQGQDSHLTHMHEGVCASCRIICIRMRP
jgi:hypothetical protein